MGWFSSSTPEPAKPAPVNDDGKAKDYKYGWEEKKYGGVFQGRTVKRQLSSIPDDMEMWRLEARSLKLLDALDEANEAIDKRPAPHITKGTEQVNLTNALEKACHRQCTELWGAYTGCLDKTKKGHEACNGWYVTYTHCIDKCGPNLMLKVLKSMTEDDPDQNLQRLRD